MVDRYTKVVLTIIAVALSVIALRGLPMTKAVAQSGPVHVIVDSFLNQDGAVQVHCQNCR